MRSIQIYDAHIRMPQILKDDDMAQAYLDDASYQLNINCKTAAADITTAQKLVTQAGGADTGNQTNLADEKTEYNRNCLQRG